MEDTRYSEIGLRLEISEESGSTVDEIITQYKCGVHKLLRDQATVYVDNMGVTIHWNSLVWDEYGNLSQWIKSLGECAEDYPDLSVCGAVHLIRIKNDPSSVVDYLWGLPKHDIKVRSTIDIGDGMEYEEEDNSTIQGLGQGD